MLDGSARQALVRQAVGKTTRQMQRLLAAVDLELTVPADKVRPLGNGHYEMKIVIDAEQSPRLRQPRGLLSHVDPHMTLGRLAREGLDRHDTGRPPRRPRAGSRTANSEQTSATKRSAPGRRAIPAATKRHVWQRDRRPLQLRRPRGTNRRCISQHLLQIDHKVPCAPGGGAEPEHLRLLCHHRHRHEGHASPGAPGD